MTTQLDCSVGLKKETTYGTAVVPDHFPEFTDENFDWNPTFVQGIGLRVGSRVLRSARRSLGKQMVAGDLTVEAGSKTHGILLEAAFGSVVSTQRGVTGVYQHNFTPTTTDTLNSYTIQKGVPVLGGGATAPIQAPGAVCSAINFALANSDKLMIKTSWNARGPVDTATAYAAPSYPTPIELFTFVQAVITIGGAVTDATTTAFATGGTAAADIVDFDFTFDNGLADNGFNIGSAGLRANKPVIGLSPLSGTVTAEYDNNVLRDAYLAQTDLALVLTFTGASNIGTGSDHPGLQIHIPNIRLESELPKANGGQVIQQKIGFTGFDNLTKPPIRVSYATTDTTP